MSPPITGIDHLLVGVRDLEAAREGYRRLGFTCTPRGSHIGWGTANYCIMFPDDYVELIGVVDPAKETNGLDVFLAHREGLKGVALASEAADGGYAALHAAGIAAAPPRDLARNLELPEGAVQPRFKLVHLPPEAMPHVPAFICQHLTPEMMRRPAWLAHPNGAAGLRAITVVVDDPPALAEAYARLLGAGAITPTDDVLTVRVGRAALLFARPDDLAELYPEVALDDAPAPPYIAGMTVAVADVAAAARVIAANGVDVAANPGGSLVVPPDQACGVIVEFCAQS